jgi:ATP-dependent RNA helicase DHX29
MAKKKKGLAPVNRGFATTSQPKKAVPVVEEAPEAEEPVINESDNLKDGTPGGGVKGGDQKNGTAADGKAAATGEDDWENEFELEEGIYQGYVERLQEKGEKEINRIIKVSESFLLARKALIS